VRVVTFDGVELTLEFATLDDQHWLRVDAAALEQPSSKPRACRRAGRRTLLRKPQRSPRPSRRIHPRSGWKASKPAPMGGPIR
jgi:hypothetical protein